MLGRIAMAYHEYIHDCLETQREATVFVELSSRKRETTPLGLAHCSLKIYVSC